MIILHHLNNSRSQRILWMLEELGIAYELRSYERDSQTMLAPRELKRIHPLGKSPVLSDGDITLAESGAIIEYLVAQGGQSLCPKLGSPAHLQYLHWLHFAEGSMMPQMVIKLLMDKVKTSPMPFFVKPIARMIANRVMSSYAGPNIIANMALVEDHLGHNSWFCGDELSAADIQMSFPLEVYVAREGGELYPAIRAYVKKFQARPAYQKALQAGGRYDYALPLALRPEP